MHDKLFLCRALRKKRTANNFFAERFFHRALWKRRTAKILFAVRPKDNAWQRFSGMANSGFPVVPKQKKHGMIFNLLSKSCNANGIQKSVIYNSFSKREIYQALLAKLIWLPKCTCLVRTHPLILTDALNSVF
jgi:hypothetical protein